MTCKHGLDREQIDCLQCEAEEHPPEDFPGIDPAFHDVCRTYGREMFALVMNAGMAQQAAAALAAFADKHQSRHAVHAVGVWSQAFNQVSNAYVKLAGWDEGTVAQCDRDIMRAFQSKIQVVQPGSLVLRDN